MDLLVTKEAVCTDKEPSDPTAKVVACTSPEAGFLLAGKGTPISQEDADRLGIKTEKAELAGWTLKMDSHSIARTPEDKAFALTQPQSGLVLAQAEQIRAAAALSVASLNRANAAKAAEAAAAAKKEDDAATAKLTAKTK